MPRYIPVAGLRDWLEVVDNRLGVPHHYVHISGRTTHERPLPGACADDTAREEPKVR